MLAFEKNPSNLAYVRIKFEPPENGCPLLTNPCVIYTTNQLPWGPKPHCNNRLQDLRLRFFRSMVGRLGFALLEVWNCGFRCFMDFIECMYITVYL